MGTVTHQALQLGLALAGVLAGVGGTLLLTGGGLVWVSRAAPEQAAGRRDEHPQTLESSPREPAAV